MTTPTSPPASRAREESLIGRYVVLKASGSRYAYVNDTLIGKTIKRYDILKGAGRWNGWNLAEAHANRLNLEHTVAELDRKGEEG